MSVTGPNLRSVRWRITAVATVISAIVLALAGIAVVLVVRVELRDNLDRSLFQRADQIEAASSGDPAAALANSDPQDRFAQVLDASGRVLFSTDNVAGAPALATLPAGQQAADTRDDVPLEDDGYRIVVRRFEVDGGARYVVVGENVDDLRDAVRALASSLGLAFPAAVACLAVVVWWLIGRTLRPVERIRREVAAIGLAELDHRVPLPPIDDEIGRLAGTMNEMLARLESAVAHQRRFVADASHELRTPLTRLRTELEVGLAVDGADLESTCRDVLADAIEMHDLIDDLLYLARSDAGGHDMPDEPVDLDVVIDHEISLVQRRAGVVVDASAIDALVVLGRPAELGRVVRNLVSNAVRAADGRVEVALHEDSATSTAVLTVDDDGPGIEPVDRGRVFDRFVRLDEARSPRGGGSGLGLAIVRDVVERRGGSIDVVGAPLGGARFVVRLPLAD